MQALNIAWNTALLLLGSCRLCIMACSDCQAWRTVDDMLAVRVEVKLRRAELDTCGCCTAAGAVAELCNQVGGGWVTCMGSAANFSNGCIHELQRNYC
jgi:hypothetical protein